MGHLSGVLRRVLGSIPDAHTLLWFPKLPPTLEALPSCPPNKVYPAADLPPDQNKAMLGPEPRTPSVGQSGRSQELCLTYPGCGAQVRLSLSG